MSFLKSVFASLTGSFFLLSGPAIASPPMHMVIQACNIQRNSNAMGFSAYSENEFNGLVGAAVNAGQSPQFARETVMNLWRAMKQTCPDVW